jgi:streptogrisin C
MELTRFLAALAVILPLAYGAPTAAADALHPQILEAMKRDLGLDSEQATARVAREIKAADVIDALRTSTGASFAGAWLSEDGAKINVGITDESLAEQVTAAGATPTIFSASLAKLQEAQKALDKIGTHQIQTLDAEANTGIASYFVDVAANKLVIEALSGSVEQAKELAAQVGLSEAEFKVETVEELPTTLATIQGGNAYYIGGGRCSIGFSVTTGFVSAGHCGRAGATASTSSGATLGTFSGSVFPGSADMSYIRASSGNTLSGTVNNYSGGSIRIAGSTATGVGGSICRSGSTTGVYCGSVSALGATVNYSQGSVTGLTRTNVCAEPGDSGGSWYTGGQAQGVTSGGSGNCASGGTTFFQPVNEILSTYGLTLVRG